MGLVGPGAQREIPTDVRPMLEGASEFEYVTVMNILTDDFAVRVGQDVPVNAPFSIGRDTSGNTNQITNTEQDARQVYGLNLKNKDYIGKKHIAIDTIIPAGQTRRFKGNEARVAVTQLVNEYMQRTGQTKQMADPEARRMVEEKIIQSRGNIQDLMDAQIQTPRAQVDEAIKHANDTEVTAFPELNTEQTALVDTSAPERRSPGRPPKSR